MTIEVPKPKFAIGDVVKLKGCFDPKVIVSQYLKNEGPGWLVFYMWHSDGTAGTSHESSFELYSKPA